MKSGTNTAPLLQPVTEEELTVLHRRFKAEIRNDDT